MKQQLPFAVAASGRAGGLIFQHYNGNTYSRSLPAFFHYPDTERQRKAQQLYWLIRRDVTYYYATFGDFIPQQQRYNKNVFNILLHCFFEIHAGFHKKPYVAPPIAWGIDNRKSVQLQFDVLYSMLVSDTVVTYGSVSSISGRRSFTPQDCHFIVISDNVELITYRHTKFKPNPSTIHIPAETYLPAGTNLYIFCALSNDEFFTNFTLWDKITI